jgi:hypothetical protein
MGGVNRRDRESRPTREYDSSELVALTKKPDEIDVDEIDESIEPIDELDPPTLRVAVGTTPPDSLTRSRTTTAYDPLTTSLLAEVTRRTQTMEEDELTPPAAEPEEAQPTASPRLIRRRDG